MYKMIFGIKALLVSAFLVLAANVLQSIYIPTLAIEAGMSPAQVSLLGSLYFTGFVIGCLAVPRYLYAVGHIRTFSSFAAVAAISTLMISMKQSPEVWMVCRFVTGFCLAALYMSIESWVSGFCDLSNRGKIISIYRIVDICGCVAGQTLLFSFSTSPYILNFVVIGFLVSSIPLSLTKIQHPVLADTGPDNLTSILRSVFKKTPLGLYGVVLSGLASGIFWSLLPLFSEANQISSKYNPALVISYLVGGALIQWPIGTLSDKIDRRKVLMLSSFIALSACWLLTYFIHSGGQSLPTLLGLVFFIGCGSIPIYSLSIAHTNDGIAKSSLVGLSVLMLVLSSSGSALGPIFFSSLSSYINAKHLFVYSGAAHTTLFLCGFYYLITKEQIEAVNKKVFMLMTRTNSLVITSKNGVRKKN